MKGDTMTTDPYNSSTYDDSYEPSDEYYEYPQAYNFSDEWMNTQEYAPIIPLSDTDDDGDDYTFDSQMPQQAPDLSEAEPTFAPGRPPRPNPDRPMPPRPDRPTPPRPDRPMPPRPDRPMPPRPDRPTPPRPDRPTPPRPDRPRPPRPSRPRPPRPRPDRPINIPIYNPVIPVQPDWSWNWGIAIPSAILPLFNTRVRFYNAAVMGPVQIYVNNRLVVSNLNYLTYSRFYNVSPGRYRITIYRGNNMSAPIVDTWMSFRQNTSYTVTLSGSRNNYWLQSTTF